MALAAGISACGPAEGGPDGGLTDGGTGGFDDHTTGRVESAAHFTRLAEEGPSIEAVKLVVTEFANAETRAIRYMDSSFYTLHDEWYWFRLLNGQAIPGDDLEPLQGFTFDRIELIYAWARELKRQNRRLPLDLAFTQGDERLYSSRFYRLALDTEPRVFGLGSLIHVPARQTPEPRPERWAFELEYQDDVSHQELLVFFQLIARTTPAEIGTNVMWLVRSPQQELLAQRMEAEALPYHQRILRYDDLIVPGEAEVYSEGLTAGRVKIVRAGDRLDDARATDVLILEHVPDYLPPCAALITARPQTPLAHVNVLARNRGIPNFHLGGVLDDPNLSQLARVSAPVVVRASAPGEVRIEPMTETEFARYQQLGTPDPIAVRPVELEGVRYVYPLEEIDFDDLARWRPILGGKSSGYVALLGVPGLEHPDRALGLSIKAYVEHVAQLQPRLRALFNRNDFNQSAALRFLVLEGIADYDARFPTAADRAFREGVLAGAPSGDVLGDTIRAGGLRRVIRDLPLAPATLAEITAALRDRFGDFASTQGLRFRSSSNVEDIEGFNGAGLYDSNTGYLDAATLPDAALRERTIEWAIKKTWASYWSFEGFEERRLEKVDHLSGAMGVLVHARFDDDKELSNGVFFFSVLPENSADQAVLELNAQLGAESVTNPTPGSGALPEVDRVVLRRGETEPRIERVRPSNLAPPGTPLVTDAQLLTVFEHARQIAERWRALKNRELPASQRVTTLTLDFEFRHTDAGWPALRSGPEFPRRFVVKQVRPLEPGLRRAQTLDRYPIPRDLLVRARRIEQRTCSDDRVSIAALEVYTDPLLRPDFGFAVAPFTAELSVAAAQDVPELGWTAGSTRTADHRALSTEHPGLEQTGRWALEATITGTTADVLRWSTLELDQDGNYLLAHGGSEVRGTTLPCRVSLVFATPKDFLLQLLDD